jgi:uncharacterized protein YbjT (DUF2867 family)
MILVTGATGANGRELVKRLVSMKEQVRAFVRDPGRAPAELRLPGVELVQGDLGDVASIERALDGVDRAFLLSSADHQLVESQGNFVRAAKSAGLRLLVKMSGHGGSASSPFRIARWHHAIERMIEDSGVPFTHIQPTQFMTVFLRNARTIASESRFYAPMGDALVTPIHERDIAEVSAKVLVELGHAGKSLVLTGPEALSYRQIGERFTRVLGREVTYVDVSFEDAKRAMIAAGQPEWFADAMNELAAERKRGFQSQVTDTVRAVLGREAIRIDEFIREKAGVFLGQASRS